ncbi:hypothetical protein EV360DRAFT_74201 [Lentinula raphanica]|nr:hypothetical protein EV360DRAFT_74201 [Lentinula raphanica]
MNHRKLNRLAKRNYRPSSNLGSDEDCYEPSDAEELSPIAKKGRFGESTTIPLRPSFLAATEANKSLLESCVFDDNVGSQQFLDKLCTTRGLDPLLLRLDNEEDNDSDIENAEYAPESQKPELYGSSPEPSSPGEPLPMDYRITVEEGGIAQIANEEQTTSGKLQEHVLQEQHENEQLIAKNYRLSKRLNRLHGALVNALDLLGSSQIPIKMEQTDAVRSIDVSAIDEIIVAPKAEEAESTAELTAKERLEAAEKIRMQILALGLRHIASNILTVDDDGTELATAVGVVDEEEVEVGDEGAEAEEIAPERSQGLGVMTLVQGGRLLVCQPLHSVYCTLQRVTTAVVVGPQWTCQCYDGTRRKSPPLPASAAPTSALILLTLLALDGPANVMMVQGGRLLVCQHLHSVYSTSQHVTTAEVVGP